MTTHFFHIPYFSHSCSYRLLDSCGPYFRYEAVNYDANSKTWIDSSGHGRNISMGNVQGSPSLATFAGGSGNSAKTFQVVRGGTGDGIRLNNPTMSNGAYTWFSVARYKEGGSSRGRIFDAYGSTTSYYTGFYGSRSGVAYHGDGTGWVTSVMDRHGSNWFVWMDQGSRIRSNGEDISRFSNTASFPAMSINWGNGGTGERSDWEVAEIMLFEYAMNMSQIRKVEEYLMSRYGIWGPERNSGDILDVNCFFPF